MTVIYSDFDIDTLITEKKRFSQGWRKLLQLKDCGAFKGKEIEIQGDGGNIFVIKLRQNTKNPMDFSAILCHKTDNSNKLFRLRRYNGKSHEHKNHIEKDVIYDFHIHFATERYQLIGKKEESYAEASTRYSTLHEAVGCLISDCGFVLPEGEQVDMFGGI